MWHEARRREKATQKLLNDHKKRADKRRGENRVDPNSLLQAHGIKAKICLDPTVYKQAVKSLVVWQGDKSITIDRFDVRATLNSIPSDSPSQSGSQQNDKNKSLSHKQTVLDLDEGESMKKILNYERYRLLIQSDLNKVPEELRLKLVTDSDVLSDAKMRKLRSNKFGTSGETSIATSQSHHFNNQKISQFRDPVKRGGAAIGFTYNAVPPPPCLLDASGDTNATQHDPSSMTSGDSVQASYMDILDLVDNDNFDLESVNVVNLDPKRIDETAKKYSLSGEELTLLARRDSLEAGGAADIIKELNRLKNKSDSMHPESDNNLGRRDNQVYGPALPPNLVASARQNSTASPPSPSSTSHSSPVRQRSPSLYIPLRNGGSNSESGESSDQPDSRTYKLDTEAKGTSTNQDQQNVNMSMKDECSSERSSSRQNRLENLIDLETKGINDDRRSDHMSPRRASTPLAYKKNCRSSRSLSRERRSRHRKSSSRRHRKTRSTSSSSSSPSSLSSMSSHSYRRSSRRKRKSRYKRDSYR